MWCSHGPDAVHSDCRGESSVGIQSDDSLGFGFYAKLAGIILAIGIGVFIAFLI